MKLGLNKLGFPFFSSSIFTTFFAFSSYVGALNCSIGVNVPRDRLGCINGTFSKTKAVMVQLHHFVRSKSRTK